MKKFISCVVLLVGLCMNSWSTTYYITLHLDIDEDWNIDNRSIFTQIIACHDNNSVYLSSEKMFQQVNIQVTDEDNNIVYEETTALIPGQTHSFAFEPTLSKTYKIVIETEGLECHGEFVLTE
ncbi:DUF3244 domain-containing protein [uncultured Bacteroides sp.]|uniref:DUF3244 domain-containing protein n=1 Tax=uncultured Bacteroides sp. TaxID=162156 RepID=UPI00261626E8|nr:DUF3244 domain-containing protein [uncultured Bacteroides sp.]